jgi:hypothetical protein
MHEIRQAEAWPLASVPPQYWRATATSFASLVSPPGSPISTSLLIRPGKMSYLPLVDIHLDMVHSAVSRCDLHSSLSALVRHFLVDGPVTILHCAGLPSFDRL